MTTGNTDEQSAMNDVFSKSSDMGADVAAPATAPEVPAPEATAIEPKPEDVIKPDALPDDDEVPLQGRDPRTGKFVPVTELVAERKKLKGERDAEARLRMEAEANAKAYREQFENLQRSFQSQQRQPQPQAEAPPIPDPYLEPEEYARYTREQINQDLMRGRVQTSSMLARAKHGNDLVEQAITYAEQARVADRFLTTADPVEACVQWFKKVQVQQEIGNDFDGFKKRVAEEAVQKALAQLKAGPQAQGQTQPPRFPGTLADQTATGAQGAAISEATAINDVFAKQQRRA